MKCKSHTIEQILAAYAAGQQVFELETDTSGEDDILIGDSEHEVLNDILYWLGCSADFDAAETLQPIELPNGWVLAQISAEEFRTGMHLPDPDEQS